jgi:phospholipid/cholesterol/gamma-HCH transport system substrate-binding protein
VSNPEKRNELYVGLFLFIGLALLGGLILQFGRFREHFGGHYLITIVFDDASGLIKGSEIRMGGARIGQVAALPELNEAVQVEVELAITNGIRIPAGSSFQINSATLLGDKLIVVIPPADKTGQFIAPGSRVQGAGPTGLDALQNNAEIVSRDVLRILKEAEATLVKVDGAVDEIRGASKQLGEAVGKINRSMLAEDNLAHFNKTLANLADVSNQWKQTSAKLDPALTETREAIASVKSAAARAEKTLANADETLASIKPALKGLPAAVDQISRTAGKAGTTFDRMNRGEGMLGAFASDNDVALDFKAFMNNLRRSGILLYQDGKSNVAQPPRSKIKGRPN